MTYQNKVTYKVFLMLVITLIGVPAFFIMGGSWQLALAFTLYGCVTNALSQIAYHRWLCHDQFVPHRLGRLAMLYGIVMSANGSPIQYVYSHLNHHKNSDKEKDTHNPVELGLFKMWLGRYKTPEDYISLRFLLRKRDVVFVDRHYWKLYTLFTLIHFIITPWLVIWQAFNFTHMWVALTWLNYAAHKDGGPSKLTGFANIWMMGEGCHDIHHKYASRLDMSHEDLTDWAGRYYIPALLARR